MFLRYASITAPGFSPKPSSAAVPQRAKPIMRGGSVIEVAGRLRSGGGNAVKDVAQDVGCNPLESLLQDFFILGSLQLRQHEPQGAVQKIGLRNHVGNGGYHDGILGNEDRFVGVGILGAASHRRPGRQPAEVVRHLTGDLVEVVIHQQPSFLGTDEQVFVVLRRRRTRLRGRVHDGLGVAGLRGLGAAGCPDEGGNRVGNARAKAMDNERKVEGPILIGHIHEPPERRGRPLSAAAGCRLLAPAEAS